MYVLKISYNEVDSDRAVAVSECVDCLKLYAAIFNHPKSTKLRAAMIGKWISDDGYHVCETNRVTYTITTIDSVVCLAGCNDDLSCVR